MDVLIIGSGGREHALAWKAAQSPQTDHIFVAPGNAGTATEPNVSNVALDPTDINALRTFAQEKQIGLTIVGPEVPLAAGIVDQFHAVGLPCLGPSQQAAQLESSKSFSKAFMQAHNIPTANYASFTTLAQALAHIDTQNLPLVIKADGLAAGKGVVIAHTKAQAIQAVTDMLSAKTLGTAGQQIIIEDYLYGEEVSFIAICDGDHALSLATSQDHKTRDDGDKGPNTGGMGAYSPAAIVTPALEQHILTTIIQPTLQGLKQAGTPYCGFLYAGLMIAPDQTVNVLEFNCRLGDPETQAILMRLQSDFITLCNQALHKQLAHASLKWDPQAALTVVLANKGYPGAYPSGQIIQGLSTAKQTDAKIFHAGTATLGNDIITQGGRVLGVTALGQTLTEAQRRAYDLTKMIYWQDIYYRHDIGHRAVAAHTPC